MDLAFNKYEGAGNDFILVDDRTGSFPQKTAGLVKFLCDRRFGIGADGLILLRRHAGFDFGMVYYNSDGKEGSMCGNGGRCIAAFAQKLGIIQEKARFMATDGEHLAELPDGAFVRLRMNDVAVIEKGEDYYYLNTGSPHFVKFMPSIAELDVFTEGQKIRYNERFALKGTNVDFVEDRSDHLFVRTYERGVENETLACGTGVVAAALCVWIRKNIISTSLAIPVKVMGGQLKVTADCREGSFTNIWLEGPATPVYNGTVNLPEF
jgi:diaminopimelate epimerase